MSETIEEHAAVFRGHLASVEWQPIEWSDVGEICFEWIAEGRHAIVSVEEDGYFGYTMLLGGTYVSGEVPDPPVSVFPDDLSHYLHSYERTTT